MPTITAPAARRRRTTSLSAVAGARDGGGPVARRLAGDVDVVLDHDGHAEQRRGLAGVEAALGLRRLGARGLRAHAAEGVELRVEALDALQAVLDELAGGRVAGAESVGLRGQGREGGGAVGGGHGATVGARGAPAIGRMPYRLEQPVLDREQRRRRPRRDAGLGVDVRDVVADGLGRQRAAGAAIALLECPRATSRSTSTSRAVSPAGQARGAGAARVAGGLRAPPSTASPSSRPRADLVAQRRARRRPARARPVRPRLGHRLADVGGGEHARGARSVAGRAAPR